MALLRRLGGPALVLGVWLAQGCSCSDQPGSLDGGDAALDAADGATTGCTSDFDCPVCPSGGTSTCQSGTCVFMCSSCADADGDGHGTGAGCLGDDCDDADPNVNASAAEICNGVDDDCSGTPDDLPRVTCGMGACTVTVDACSGGAPQTCTPGTPAAMESCSDGIDDDCNGMVDDGCACTDGATQGCWSGDPTLRGVGACTDGMQTCSGSAWGACTGEGASSAETCNGTDDDCNGTDDDGLGSMTCGMGTCMNTVMNCVGGVPQTCMPGTPGTETCNNADDDCNGTVDDLGMTTCGMGACTVSVPMCVGGVMQTCTPLPMGTEVCNGIDDDCNGMPDDGLGSMTCGMGPCTNTTMNCVGGMPQTCTPLPPGTETCNGIDDDCDGAIDNGATMACYTGPAATRGVGACTDGGQSCGGGACTGEVLPARETCNGMDDDCNMMVDDGIASTTCGLGACRMTVAGCAMCTPGTPGAESCNGIDDDCDGSVDNGAAAVACYTGPAPTRNVGACRDGLTYCPGGVMGPCTGDVTPSAEACDGIDDDCDSNVDEGLGNFACGIGACARMVPACTGGMAATCMPGAPTSEVCGNLIDENCNGVLDDGCSCTHVSPRGNDTSGTGTAAAPFRTIAFGITAASRGMGLPPRVCVASTTTCNTAMTTTIYPEAITMVNGVSVFGGYLDGGAASTSWMRNANCITRISDQNATGVFFGPTVTMPTTIDSFTIVATNDPSNAAITVQGSAGAIINNNDIQGGAGTTSIGVNVIDSGGLVAATPQINNNAIVGGTGTALAIGVRSLRSAPVITSHCSARDSLGRCQSYGCSPSSTRYIRGRGAGGTSTEVYGVRLEDSPGALVADNGICGGGSTASGAAVRLSGAAAGTIMRANNLDAGGLTRSVAGFWATDCSDASPWLVDNWQVAASCGMLGCRADGVRAIGACHPVVDSNRLIIGGEESSNNDANGVYCGRDTTTGLSSRCVVLGNQEVRGSFAGIPPTSVGVRCDDGACALIARNALISGWAGQNAMGVVLGNTDAVVEDNYIDAGCATVSAAGIMATNSFARIQNNVIAGSSQAMCVRLMRATTPTRNGPTWGVRLVLAGTNEVDLHSNTIFGEGTAGNTCTSRAIGLEATTGGIPPAPRGIIRNNIAIAGLCGASYAIEESIAAVDPRIVENNDLIGLPAAATALYRDEGATNLTTIVAVNGLTDIAAANNISVDPMLNATFHIPAGSACVDAGTATGAPTTDFEGQARPAMTRFDIGADEYIP